MTKVYYEINSFILNCDNWGRKSCVSIQIKVLSKWGIKFNILYYLSQLVMETVIGEDELISIPNNKFEKRFRFWYFHVDPTW